MCATEVLLPSWWRKVSVAGVNVALFVSAGYKAMSLPRWSLVVWGTWSLYDVGANSTGKKIVNLNICVDVPTASLSSPKRRQAFIPHPTTAGFVTVCARARNHTAGRKELSWRVENPRARSVSWVMAKVQPVGRERNVRAAAHLWLCCCICWSNKRESLIPLLMHLHWYMAIPSASELFPGYKTQLHLQEKLGNGLKTHFLHCNICNLDKSLASACMCTKRAVESRFLGVKIAIELSRLCSILSCIF